MKFPRLILLFIIFTKTAISQNTAKLDSLLKVLPGLKDDTTKVKTLVRICHQYGTNNPQKLLEYSEKARKLSQEVKWKRGIGMSYSLMADAYYGMGNFPKSLEYRLLEIEKWKELEYKWQTCSALSNLATVYSDIGDNVKSVECHLTALKFAEDINHKESILITLTNLASLYKSMSDTVHAYEYHFKALKLSKEYGYPEYEAINLGNLGSIYSDQKKLGQSILFYEKALQIDEKMNNKQNIIGWLANIGGTYQLLSDSATTAGNLSLAKEYNEKALKYLNNALKDSKEIGNVFLEASILANIAATYVTLKRYDDATKLLTQSQELASSIHFFELIVKNLRIFHEINKKTGNYQKALEYHEKYVALDDSVSGILNRQKISELEIKFETEKKEALNRSLAQQNKILELSITNNKFLMYGLMIILFLILSIGFLIFRQNKLKSRQENVRLEQKLLRTQMNPHFIFNSLSGIESFIYEHQPKEAGNYLAQFARLMRLILENSASEYISLDKEIETLNYYLSLQKLRLNDNLQYNIEVNDISNPEQIFLPPMLTQPFIENAIEHGFRGLKECGIINISFGLKDNYLEIKIRDNGIGIVQAQQQKDLYKEHKSMAMQITHERLKYLNKSKKQKLIFIIREVNEQNKIKGTEVQFAIPL